MDELTRSMVCVMGARTEQDAATELLFQSGRRPENGAGYPDPLGADVMEIEALMRQVMAAANFTATALFFLNDERPDQGAPALPTALLSVLNRWNHG